MISIVVPVFQAKKSLRRCVESILAQTYRELEILLVDDGSSDGSGEICDEYAKIDARITVIHKENAGVSEARNTGIKKATGKYVQFVDSDDYLEIDCCENLIQAVEKTSAELVICGYHHWFSGRDYVKEPSCMGLLEKNIMGEQWLTLYEQGYLNMPWNKLFCREYITEFFDPSISLGEDLLFNLAYMKQINRIVFLPKPLYHYIQAEQSNSLSAKKRDDKLDLSIRIMKAMQAFYVETTGQQPSNSAIEVRFVKEYFDEMIGFPIDQNSSFVEKKNKILQYLKVTELQDACHKVKLKQMDYRLMLWLFQRQWVTMLLALVYIRHGILCTLRLKKR